jgi:hypothetical protein
MWAHSSIIVNVLCFSSPYNKHISLYLKDIETRLLSIVIYTCSTARRQVGGWYMVFLLPCVCEYVTVYGVPVEILATYIASAAIVYNKQQKGTTVIYQHTYTYTGFNGNGRFSHKVYSSCLFIFFFCSIYFFLCLHLFFLYLVVFCSFSLFFIFPVLQF